jgi:glycosyltransferase involved in cell wall biosynthesis
MVDGLAFGALPDAAEAQAGRLRLIALVHHPLAAETGLAPESARALRASETRALATARAIVVTGLRTAQTLSREHAVAPARITIIEPGAPEPAAARGVRHPGPWRLLCVATLVPRKGHELLLQALAARGGDDWTLECIGSMTRDAACATGIVALADSLGLGARVSFRGECPAEAVRQAYDSADLFVLPAWYEGYGMAVAEAIAHGLPVVATAVGAVPQLVGDDAGLLVPPGDAAALQAALRRILADIALRERLAAGAARRATQLPRWQDAGARLAALLGRVATT